MSSFLFTHHFGDSAAAYEWIYRYPTFFTSCLCLGSVSGWPHSDLCCDGSVTSLICYHPSVSPPDFLWLHWVAWTETLSSPRTAVARSLVLLVHTIQLQRGSYSKQPGSLLSIT